MHAARANRQLRQAGLRQALRDKGLSSDQGRIGLQIVKLQFTQTIRRLPGKQAQFQADQGDRQLRTHSDGQHLAGIGAEPGRNIHRQYRQTTDIQQPDSLGIRFAYCALQTRAKQSIEHHALQLDALAPGLHRHTSSQRMVTGQRGIALQLRRIADRQHLHPPACTQRQGRHQIAVTCVITAPGQHRQHASIRPTPAQSAPDSMRGATHQFKTRRAGCDQSRIQLTHLGGAVQRQGKIVRRMQHASAPMSGRIIPTCAPVTCPHMNTDTLDLIALAQSIKDWGRELGFQQVGIADVQLGEHEAHLQRWLDAGYQGEMDYMAAHGSKRSHPDELVPGTLRVVSLRMDYLPGDTQMAQRLGEPEKAYVSRYALGRDYHKLIRKRLQQLAERIQQQIGPFGYRAFVDSAPVLEKAIAEQAGLGWIGKNTLVLNRKAGSYFFLGELFVDLPLPVDPPHASEHCGRCTACMDICPTAAFVGPYVLDARRCISYLTIELKGSIPEELRAPIGNRVFGCDDCQMVCPWNRFAKPTEQNDFQPRHSLDNAELAELFCWSEDEFLSRTEGSPLRRAGYERWLRNLAVGLGNAPSSIPVLEALKARREHPSELVREHVEWALARHGL